MKRIIAVSLLCAGVVGICGCSKEQSAETKTPAKTTESVVPAPTGPAQAAEAAATAVQQQAQGIIERVKGLVADNKYQDALTTLGQVKDLKLTAEQQKAVDDLKAKIQAALAKVSSSDAASAVGGALGK